MTEPRRWAVVFGGPSPEHEISILTGLQAERILTTAGDVVVPLYWAPTGSWHVVPSATEAADYLEGVPRGSRDAELVVAGSPGIRVKKRVGTERIEVDAALLCLHGGLGEGGGGATLFGLLGIPATGGSPFAGALGMDKLAFGGVVGGAGLPSLPRELLRSEVAPSFPAPYIVKPRYGGSSIGIEVVEDHAAAAALARSSAQLRAGAVVEPYRPDLVDLNIGVRTYPVVETSPVERPLRAASDSGGIYGYVEKYLSGAPGTAGFMSAPREFPAILGPGVAESAARFARSVVELTGLTGILRVDLLHSPETGELYVNEVNSIPGAMALYLWSDAVPVDRVLRDALSEAVERPFRLPSAVVSPGAALRAAGGIAGKLIGLDVSRR